MVRFLSKTAPVIYCPFSFALRQLGLNDDRIAQVKQANDIADVVGGYLSLRPAGPTFKGLCPFHEDKHPSFDVDPRRQRYRCWSCGKVGDVISFVMEMDKISFREALEILARRAGITLGGPRSGSQSQRAEPAPQSFSVGPRTIPRSLRGFKSGRTGVVLS